MAVTSRSSTRGGSFPLVLGLPLGARFGFGFRAASAAFRPLSGGFRSPAAVADTRDPQVVYESDAADQTAAEENEVPRAPGSASRNCCGLLRVRRRPARSGNPRRRAGA